MRAKVFFIIFLLLISFTIAVEQNETEDMDIVHEKEIAQCVEEFTGQRIGDTIIGEDSAISHCAKVVGTMVSINVNKIKSDDGNYFNLIFPYGDNVLKVQDIPCDDPKALIIGFFHPERHQWIAIDTNVEVNEGETLTDNTYSFITQDIEQSEIVDFLNDPDYDFLYFSLLKKQPPVTLDMDCIENVCDFTKGIYTQDEFRDPFDGIISLKGLEKEKYGDEWAGSNLISFRVCGLPVGCDPSDETCDNHCTIYTSEYCAEIYDGFCSNEAGDCCNPAHDGVCDPDCAYGVDPDCICSIEDDGCCIGFGSGILVAPKDQEFVKILSSGLCGYLGYYSDECEINPGNYEDIFEPISVSYGDSSWGYIHINQSNFYNVNGDPNCPPQFYFYPEKGYSVYSLTAKETQHIIRNDDYIFSIKNLDSEDLISTFEEEGYDSKYFNYGERLSTMGVVPVDEITSEHELLEEIYKDFKYLEVDACDYSVDGECSELCSSYEIDGEEFNPVTGEYEDAVVTWHADPDCCDLEKWELNNAGDWEVVGKGPIAATNKQDGCCKPACDGVCDPDCLPGLDPDCSADYHVSPEEMIDYVDARMDKYSDRSKYYSSDSNLYFSYPIGKSQPEAKCVGCGNGRCEFYVWGGGRLAWPTTRNVWMVTPSLHDITSNNWNYISQDYPELTNPALTYPINIFIERRFYNEMNVFCGENFGRVDDDGKIHADCVRVFYKDVISGDLKRDRRKKGFGHTAKGWDSAGVYYDHPWGWTYSNNWLYDKNPLQLDEYGALHDWFIDSINLQYNSWPTFYPFDQDPDNCPEDCGVEITCGNGVCEPWEMEGEKYPCPQDCVEVLDYDWAKYPLITMFRMAQMDDHHERDYDNPKSALDGRGYCITSQSFYYESGVTRDNIENTLKYTDIGSIALCAFAHPGDKGNCPAGMVCDESCRCVSLNDVKIVDIDDTLFETNDHYYKLRNMIDMDLDGVPDIEDCNPRNTKISPFAVEVCDGMDTNCDGVVDGGGVCKKIIHVCKTYDEDFDPEVGCFASWCVCDPDRNDEACVGEGVSTLDGCFVEIDNLEPSDEPRELPYYMYVCEPGKPCKEPLKSGTFTILPSYETNCDDGIDNDGDGLIDMEDPDCWFCEEGECLLTSKQWCNIVDGESVWVEEYYCQMCGHLDSTCAEGMEDVEPCKENEDSCDGGCLPGACDIEAKLVCNDQGYWVKNGYETKCFSQDSELSTEPGECDTSACDVVHNKSCVSVIQGMPSEWNPNNYCTSNLVCGWMTDYDCRNYEKSCIHGSCDIEKNAYCDNGNWMLSTDYCDYCGAIDSDCGFKACQEGFCDYDSYAKCIDGKWEFLERDEYCDVCSHAPDPNDFCFEPEVEEGKECIPGRTMVCGSNIGLCQTGIKTCDSEGFWRDCVGDVGPKTEICNGFDDNCDGSIDDGCVGCTAGEMRSCGTMAGYCSPGVQICNDQGIWGTCTGKAYSEPKEEICDGIDNNCNGVIDEGCDCIDGDTQECGSDVGECKKGLQYCIDGEWGPCIGEVGPVEETGLLCSDGLDNNCNGFVDSDDDSCNALSANELTPTCYDSIKNQGEEGIDCGGPCPPCEEVTCNDGKRNGNEEGIDCGGSFCPPCNPNDKSISKPTGLEDEPICGDGVCDPGEDEFSCPQDCAPIEEEVSFPWAIIIVVIILLGLLGGGGYLFWMFKKSGKPFNQFFNDMKNKMDNKFSQLFKKKSQTVQKQEVKTQPQQKTYQQQPQYERKRTKPRFGGVESKLEKSFGEAEELFKKKKK